MLRAGEEPEFKAIGGGDRGEREDAVTVFGDQLCRYVETPVVAQNGVADIYEVRIMRFDSTVGREDFGEEGRGAYIPGE